MTTRRQFCKQLTAGGAATSFGLGLGLGNGWNTVLGQSTAATSTGKTSANDKLGVMLVGCGSRGNSHLTAFLADPRTDVLVVCDPDEKRAAAAAAQVAAQQGFAPVIVQDMRKGLETKGVDIVTNAATNHWHALCGIWAMQAKKHCYLEKPICHNIHEGRSLVAAAKKYGVLCQVGTQSRSNASIAAAVQFIRDGGIGTVNLARGLCYKRRKSIGAFGEYTVPAGVDYDLWSGPAPIAPVTRPRFHYDWHWQRLYGNGDFGNQGPHQCDIARWMLGVDDYPTSILTYGGRLGYQAERKDDNYRDAGDVANTEVSILRYGGNTGEKYIVFETRGLETPPLAAPVNDAAAAAGIGVIAYGSEGYLVIGQSGPEKISAYDKKGKVIKSFSTSGDSGHFRNFVDAVVANKSEQLNSDVRCGVLSASIFQLGNISYYLGERNVVSVETLRRELAAVPSSDDNSATLDRTLEHLTENGVDLKKYPLSLGPRLTFSPETMQFTDSPAGNAMLSRNYRAPYIVPTAEQV